MADRDSPGFPVSSYRVVLSPCTGVCMLGDDGLCLGCRRTAREIAAWPQMGDDERLRLMDCVLPSRGEGEG